MKQITIDPITRLEGHGKIEIFLLHKVKGRNWQCLIGGRGAKVGLEIEFKQKVKKLLEQENFLAEFKKVI